MAWSYSNTLSQLSPPNELPVLIRGLVTESDDLPKVRRLNSRQIINARMAYMIGIMEEIEAWENTEDDEIRLNKSSVASTAIKILLFEAEVNQVSTKILLTINTEELVVFENLCSHLSGYWDLNLLGYDTVVWCIGSGVLKKFHSIFQADPECGNSSPHPKKS